MAASAALLYTVELIPGDALKTGKRLVLEIHEVTYDSDATCEVDTNLTQVIGVFAGVCKDVSAPAANILGSDKVITSGAVTVGATANNSDTFMVMFLGYL